MERKPNLKPFIGHNLYSIVPNQARKVESFFQQWMALPEAHKVVKTELDKIDTDLGQEYSSTVVEGVKSLVTQLSIEESQPAIDLQLEDVDVPPKSPRRRRRTSESGLTLFFVTF
jgi:hypothetical protein